MKAGKVLDILQISRSTLKAYREKGYLKYTKLPTGQFNYDADSVYLLKNKHQPRETILYARVSTYEYETVFITLGYVILCQIIILNIKFFDKNA